MHTYFKRCLNFSFFKRVMWHLVKARMKRLHILRSIMEEKQTNREKE